MCLKLSVYLHFFVNKGLEFQSEVSGGSVEDLRLHNHWGRTSSAVKAVSQRACCPNKARGIQPKLWPQFPPANPGVGLLW